MKNLSKLTALLSAAAKTLSLAACSSGNAASTPAPADTSTPTDTAAPSEGATYTVGICQLVTHDALDAATQGFIDALTEELGDAVTFDVQNAAGDSNTCSTIVNSFVAADVDLILANATAALQAAVDEYNAKCAAGKDDLYGKDAQYLIAIQQGPFYIAKIHEAIEGPLGGVKTNRKFQPVLPDGGVLDNVWVIGLDGIMLYRDVYPIDVPGSASAECINGGRSAANQAHELVQA